ncbi:MAG: lantibiotic dehydratase [Natronosporangium sp.]
MYQSVDDAVMVRAALLRQDQLDRWPDLTGPDAAANWKPWLREALQLPGFAVALAHATPELAGRANAAIDGAVSQADTRRVVVAVMRYLLRAATRATPFGLFAGVAPATASRASSVRLGNAHRAVARLQAPWLAVVLDDLEADLRLRPHLMVRANGLVVERGDRVVLENRAATNDCRGAPVHLRIKTNHMIRAALALAAEPIRWSDLTAKLTAECAAPPEGAERLIGQLVSQRLLVTSLRPPSTATDPLTHVLDQLEAAEADGGEVGEPLTRLRRVRNLKLRHDGTPDLAASGSYRRELGEAAAAVTAAGPAVGVDLLLDCDLVLPTTVTAEACRAAAALTRLARPTTAAWRDWHERFLNRYGLHALVPVLDAVDAQVGIGYPDGFTGQPVAAWSTVTDRDRVLLALAQRAALRREHEIILDDTLLDRLTGPAPGEIQPTAELTVRVHASSLKAVADGDFQLSIVRACAQAYSTAGRFLDLFAASDRRRMAERAADTPPASSGALLAQLSAVTRYTISLDINRATQVLPHLIPVGEYHDPSPTVIGLDDIAVTADAYRLYLVSVSHQRALQPVAVNAVEPVRHAHPLTRFLAEAPAAHATGCLPFEWGPAGRGMPFLPGLRYGRTLLSPPRWLLTAAELPNRTAAWQQWDQALAGWLDVTGCPAAVSLGIGDQTIGLDLDEPAHRALLRDHLNRNPTALLRAAYDGTGWIGGHPHELVIPLTATTSTPPAPRLSRTPVDVRAHGILPGNRHQYLKIYARPAEQTTILTAHLPRLVDTLPAAGRWWFLRHANPQPHLRLRTNGLPTEAITDWTQQLANADLTRHIQWDTDLPEPGRFGSPAAYQATIPVFAADSAAVLAQLTLTERRPAPDWQALTAASMVDLVTAVIGDPQQALQWLIAHTRTHKPAPQRAVHDQAIELANPHDHSTLAGLPGGEQLLIRWEQRRRILAAWRDSLPTASPVPPVELLPDLLHLHHARMAGIDLDSERVCLHLARAAALSWTARRNR